jgi:O-antigen/teichoic acid export membrane protein
MGLALNGGTLGGLLVVFALGALRLSTACGIVALFAILPASVVIHRMRDAIAFAPERLVVDWRTNWAQGRWVLSSTVINVLGVRAMPWLTLLWWSTEVVATVGVVVAVAGLVRPALQATLNYLTPALARTAHVAGARHTIRRGVQLMVAGAVAGAVYVPVMALLGDPLVGVLYSPAYQGERIALVILGAAFGLRAVYVPARATSTALHQSRTLARSSLLGAVVSLAAGCAAIPAWGVTGVAVAILCQAIALLAVNCYDLRGAFQALPGESMDASARGAA